MMLMAEVVCNQYVRLATLVVCRNRKMEDFVDHVN